MRRALEAVGVQEEDMTWCSGVMGVPITFLDRYDPEQFEIVAFRKGEDGKDLIFTREREREFNRTFVSLFDGHSGDDQKCRGYDKWENHLRQNNNTTQVEPVDVILPLRWQMCDKASVNGTSVYARLFIRQKQGGNPI